MVWIKRLLMLFILLISCEKKQEIENIHLIKFLESKEEQLNWKVHQKFILLDNSSKDALFAIIDKIIIKNDHVYILDIRGKMSVLCFDIKGNFIRSYGQTGRGPGEHMRISDFDVDFNSDVFLYCRSTLKVIHFHENGSLMNEYRFDFRANGFKLLKEGEFFFSMVNVNKNRNQFSIYNPSTRETQKILPNFDRKDQTNRTIKSYTQNINEGFISYIPVRDEFIVFNESGDIQEFFSFDFGKYTLPQKYKYDALSWENASGIYYFLDATPILINDYILGEFMSFANRYIFVYNTLNYELFIDRIDASNYSHNSLYPFWGVFKEYIISHLDIELLEASIDNELIPAYVIEHVKEGGVVITLSTLIH